MGYGKPLTNSLFSLEMLVGITVNDTTLGTTVAKLGSREVPFPKPVVQGDTVRVRTTVLSVRSSQSRPTVGLDEFEHVGFQASCCLDT